MGKRPLLRYDIAAFLGLVGLGILQRRYHECLSLECIDVYVYENISHSY